MKILLTGFEPFGGESVNPALEAVKLVKAPENVELVKLEIPCVFGKCIDAVIAAVEKELPDAVLCVGLAAGRAALTPERVAINVRDARIPDNAGYQPVDEPVDNAGPAAYFATLPIREMAKAIEDAGIPATVSNTAGTFCCNDVMYGLLSYLEDTTPEVMGGFIHVPCIPEQLPRFAEGTPALTLAEIVKGLEAALSAIVKA